MSSSVFAVVTAAGSGSRLGHDTPKALVQLAGVSLVRRAVDGIRVAGVDGVVVTAPPTHLGEFEQIFAQEPDVAVVPGGNIRQDSVYNGLLEIPRLAKRIGKELDERTPVLIHDAARCLTPKRAIRDVIEALESGLKAVIPVVPVTDTQKIVEPVPTYSKIEKVIGQVDRAQLRGVQTPQGFHWETAMRAHEAGRELLAQGVELTDDAGLVEALGEDVHVTPGSALSMKITTKLDLVVAAEILARPDRYQSLLEE